jgi:hypothetical protein
MTHMPDARFPVETIGGVPVVRAPEEMDITNAGYFRAALLILRIFAISGLDRVIACHDDLGQALVLSGARQPSPARCA